MDLIREIGQEPVFINQEGGSVGIWLRMKPAMHKLHNYE